MPRWSSQISYFNNNEVKCVFVSLLLSPSPATSTISISCTKICCTSTATVIIVEQRARTNYIAILQSTFLRYIFLYDFLRTKIEAKSMENINIMKLYLLVQDVRACVFDRFPGVFIRIFLILITSTINVSSMYRIVICLII